MRQVKLFKGVEAELSDLESEVNKWLRTNKAEVVNIFGNIAPQTFRTNNPALGGERQYPPSDVLIAIVYESA